MLVFFIDLRYLDVRLQVLVLVQSEGPRVPHCSVELVGIFPRSVVVTFVILPEGAGIVAP